MKNEKCRMKEKMHPHFDCLYVGADLCVCPTTGLMKISVKTQSVGVAYYATQQAIQYGQPDVAL